jgi:hypothetical protein
MNTLDSAVYSEAAQEHQIREVPLSHLSIEVGHFYMDDLRTGEDRIRAQFKRVAPWIAAARATVDAGRGTARVSTCFLIDDYFRDDTDPGEVLEMLIRIAGECGVPIDYVAREAGCCVADDVPVAGLVAERLLPEPAPGTNGTRPPVHESGWLCNGLRSDEPGSDQAMRAQEWRPAAEFGRRNHSIFLDVELWRTEHDRADGTPVRWSCPFLASVWQLLRLGMLRYEGAPVAEPRQWPPGMPWPEQWADLPAVIRLNPEAAPFAAYRSVSILPTTYLPVENAVALILGHLSLDESVTDQVVARGAREGLRISRSVTRRISHIFIDEA